VARPGGLELPTFWFVAEQSQILSACSGVAYERKHAALTRAMIPKIGVLVWFIVESRRQILCRFRETFVLLFF
jgi:hypothetical protein